MKVEKADLVKAEAGSWYTILGVSGSEKEWVQGMEDLLAEKGIGKPVAWYFTTGADVNAYANPTDSADLFPANLKFLLFPLDGLDVGKLARFKMIAKDRWFDDVVQNIRRRSL